MSQLAPTKGVTSVTPDQLAALSSEVAALVALDLHGLRVRWRKLFRTDVPPHLSKALLLRIIAYRIQAKALGDLDRDTIRLLDGICRQRSADGNGRAHVPAVQAPRSVMPGTVFVREYDGVVHRVTVAESGYSWDGRSYRSLSEIARGITGTRWNGPRFFGLRADRNPSTTKDNK